ncbi:MAG: hypothetical protein VXA98_05200, partial [Gammaproteobacteria bacterium]
EFVVGHLDSPSSSVSGFWSWLGIASEKNHRWGAILCIDACGRRAGSVVPIGLRCPEPVRGLKWYPNQDEMARLLRLA